MAGEGWVLRRFPRHWPTGSRSWVRDSNGGRKARSRHTVRPHGLQRALARAAAEAAALVRDGVSSLLRYVVGDPAAARRRDLASLCAGHPSRQGMLFRALARLPPLHAASLLDSARQNGVPQLDGAFVMTPPGDGSTLQIGIDVGQGSELQAAVETFRLLAALVARGAAAPLSPAMRRLWTLAAVFLIQLKTAETLTRQLPLFGAVAGASPPGSLVAASRRSPRGPNRQRALVAIIGGGLVGVRAFPPTAVAAA